MKPNEMRAAKFRGENGFGTVPDVGTARSQPFLAEYRASTVIWNDQERYKLEGYASVVGRKYRMYDMFGEYDEVVMPGAFDETLAAKPDVAYLVNHRGVTMARTTNGSLELSADSKGLATLAYLNPKRQDVKDLIVAVEDKDITEMSFAFMITDGEWNEDYTEYQINAVDIDRGDVSAVNFGANPYTSVKARQQEIIRDFRMIPRAAQEEALRGTEIGEALQWMQRREAPGVDNAITDPDTLIAEQWLARMQLIAKR